MRASLTAFFYLMITVTILLLNQGSPPQSGVAHDLTESQLQVKYPARPPSSSASLPRHARSFPVAFVGGLSRASGGDGCGGRKRKKEKKKQRLVSNTTVLPSSSSYPLFLHPCIKPGGRQAGVLLHHGPVRAGKPQTSSSTTKLRRKKEEHPGEFLKEQR